MAEHPTLDLGKRMAERPTLYLVESIIKLT